MQHWRSDKGFSLVEVMVVVAIIGLMTSAVVLALPGSDDRLRDTLGRTGRLMVALERQAVMTGQVMGVHFTERGMAVLELGDAGWVPTDAVVDADAATFGNARLRALEVDGAAVDLQDTSRQAHVFILPTGEKPSFSLTLVSGTQTGTITVPQMGPFEVKTDG